jgi:hypothetical protein
LRTANNQIGLLAGASDSGVVGFLKGIYFEESVFEPRTTDVCKSFEGILDSAVSEVERAGKPLGSGDAIDSSRSFRDSISNGKDVGVTWRADSASEVIAPPIEAENWPG